MLINNYNFYKHYPSKGNASRWSCTWYGRKCRAHLIIINDSLQVLRADLKHNHSPAKQHNDQPEELIKHQPTEQKEHQNAEQTKDKHESKEPVKHQHAEQTKDINQPVKQFKQYTIKKRIYKLQDTPIDQETVAKKKEIAVQKLKMDIEVPVNDELPITIDD